MLPRGEGSLGMSVSIGLQAGSETRTGITRLSLGEDNRGLSPITQQLSRRAAA